MNPLKNNYSRWRVQCFDHESVTAFLAEQKWPDGIHRIQCPGTSVTLDLLFEGDPLAAPVVPVFFTGRVADRKSKQGPFFSGRNIASQGGFGYIAVSDPGLLVDPSVNLAWYAGTARIALQEMLTDVLLGLSSAQSAELLLVGGSGGGFASLVYGGRLGGAASSLVWNPQTDVLRYVESSVRAYLRHGLAVEVPVGASLESAREHVQATQLSAVGAKPRRLVYLQNSADWHVGAHLRPFLREDYASMGRGIIEAGEDRSVMIAMMSDGHGAPSLQLIGRAIHALLDPRRSATSVVDELIARASVDWAVPDTDLSDVRHLIGDHERVAVFPQ